MAAQILNFSDGRPSPSGKASVDALREGCCKRMHAAAVSAYEAAITVLTKLQSTSDVYLKTGSSADLILPLQSEKHNFLAAFNEHFRAPFVGSESAPPISLYQFTRRPVGPDEALAASTLLKRTEERCGDSVRLLNARIESLRIGGSIVPRQILSAHHLVSAFVGAVSGLRVPATVKPIIYRMYDRALSEAAPQLYDFAMEALAPLGGAAPVQRYDRSGQDRPPMNQNVRQLIDGLSADENPERQIARQDLLNKANDDFDATLSHYMLTVPQKNALEPLRLPWFRSSLDTSEPAAADRKVFLGALDQLASMCTENLGGDLAPPSLKALVIGVICNQGPTGRSLEAAINQVKMRLSHQRESRVAAMHQRVLESIELKMTGMRVPPEINRVVKSGLAVIMAQAVIDSGRYSLGYTTTWATFEALLDSVDPKMPRPSADHLFQLSRSIRAALVQVGFTEPDVESAMLGVRMRWSYLDQQAAFPGLKMEIPEFMQPDIPAPVVTEPTVPPCGLSHEDRAALLVPEHFYRVYDPETSTPRWMQLTSYYAEQASLSFSAVAGAPVSMSVDRFVDDIRKGLSDIIDPNPDMRRVLLQLRPAPESPNF